VLSYAYATIQRPVAFTDVMASLVFLQVLKAVEKAGYRVTTTDVAALAGVDLSTAQKVGISYLKLFASLLASVC